jgi:hypothetical protein
MTVAVESVRGTFSGQIKTDTDLSNSRELLFSRRFVSAGRVFAVAVGLQFNKMNDVALGLFWAVAGYVIVEC